MFYATWFLPLINEVFPLWFFASLGRFLMGYGSAFLLYSTGIPTLMGALFWRLLSERHFERMILAAFPIAAASLFIASVGLSLHAWYVSFWLAIPLSALITSQALRNSLLFRVFACSLLTHAVGSLLVVATAPAVNWYGLMPVVCFERVLTMLMMYAVARLLAWVRTERLALP